MNNETSFKLVKKIIAKHGGVRAFARMFGEETGDVSRWNTGKRIIHPRAVCSVCRVEKDILPYQLNSKVFPEDLKFVYAKKK